MRKTFFEEKHMQMKRKGLAAVVVLTLLVTVACNWELNVYRVLSEAQVGYDSYFRAAVELHEKHVMDDATYAKAKDVAQRIYDLGHSGTAMMVTYQKLKAPELRAKIDAAVAELPALIAELFQLVEAFKPKPAAATPDDDYLVREMAFRVEHDRLLSQIDNDLTTIETLR
jgi:hypothetical protein